MACDKEHLYEYLADFEATRPIESVYCPYAQDAGAGMGVPTFALFFFGFIGLALTVRTQHPGPILVAGILSAGVVATRIPGAGARVMALVLFFGVSVLGFMIYRRAKSGGL